MAFKIPPLLGSKPGMRFVKCAYRSYEKSWDYILLKRRRECIGKLLICFSIEP